MAEITLIGYCELVKKIGDIIIDPEPFHLGVEGGENTEKCT